MYKAVDEIRTTVRSVEDDVQKIKTALVQHLPEEDRQDIFHLEQHNTVESFEAFCQRLDDPNFRKLVVSILLINYIYIMQLFYIELGFFLLSLCL